MDDKSGTLSEDEMRSKLRIYLIATGVFAFVSQLMLFCFDYRPKTGTNNTDKQIDERVNLIKGHDEQKEKAFES